MASRSEIESGAKMLITAARLDRRKLVSGECGVGEVEKIEVQGEIEDEKDKQPLLSWLRDELKGTPMMKEEDLRRVARDGEKKAGQFT